VTYVETPCMTKEQAIEFKRRSEEITAQQNAEQCKRIRAIEDHQDRRQAAVEER